MSNDCCVIGQRTANAVGTLHTHDLQRLTVQLAICKTCTTCNAHLLHMHMLLFLLVIVAQQTLSWQDLQVLTYMQHAS